MSSMQAMTRSMSAGCVASPSDARTAPRPRHLHGAAAGEGRAALRGGLPRIAVAIRFASRRTSDAGYSAAPA
jgi:hypothetical protein